MNFRPLTPERAEQIRRALRQARMNGRGISIDRDSGEFAGTETIKDASEEKVNMIGKFDTHYFR
jgi:hypothetical protein